MVFLTKTCNKRKNCYKTDGVTHVFYLESLLELSNKVKDRQHDGLIIHYCLNLIGTIDAF